MNSKSFVITLCLGILLLSIFKADLVRSQAQVPENLNIAIQPYGKFDRRLAVTVIQGLVLAFRKVNIIMLPARQLPEDAYYRERKRYRADKILDHLESLVDTTRYYRIIGLTDQDISASRKEFYDVGILGLTRLQGHASIVSIYRLGRKKVHKTIFLRRLTNLVNHHLGQSLGLPLCQGRCLMKDFGIKGRNLDLCSGKFCVSCDQKIKKRIKAACKSYAKK